MGSSNARRRSKQQRRDYSEPIKIITPTDSAPRQAQAESQEQALEVPVIHVVEAAHIQRESAMADEVLQPIKSPASVNGPQTTHGRHNGQQTPTPTSELTPLLDSLRAIFVNDRAIGSHADVGRCGICYLIFVREELHFHEEEGFYACITCETALGTARLPMVHRQRK